MEEFVENLCSFDFARDLVVNAEDKEEIDFETLDIENSNESDESEINGKDEEALTLEDSVTNETKKSTCCNYWLIYDIISNKKVTIWLLSNITGENFRRGKETK